MTEEEKSKFCELLKEAMKDEEKATEIYDAIVTAFNDVDWRRSEPEEKIPVYILSEHVISNIRSDETKHKHLLEMIRDLTCPIHPE